MQELLGSDRTDPRGATTEQKLNAPTVINQTALSLTNAEFEVLKKGPRFIMNDPEKVIKRKADELKRVYEKIRNRNAEQGWILPLDRLDAFIEGTRY